MSRIRRIIPLKFQKIIVWFPFVNVLVYPMWYYNLFVTKARPHDLFASWMCCVIAAMPWVILGMIAESHVSGLVHRLDTVSYFLSHCGALVMGLVLIRFQEKVLKNYT